MVAKLVGISVLIILSAYFCGRIVAGRKIKDKPVFLNIPVGLLMMFSLFFVICLPAIYLRRTLTEVMVVYFPVCAVLVAIGIVMFMVDQFKADKIAYKIPVLSKEEIIYLLIFAALVAYQMYHIIFYAVADGDDAFYVAVAEGARTSDTMYLNDPYTGWVSQIPYRYALAPFPMWLASLARLAGLAVAPLAHISIPVTFTIITYVIYNSLAKLVFKENSIKRYMFLSLFALFCMFGNFSISTAETFMLSRARQGKEALAAIVIPFGIYVMIRILEDKKLTARNIIMIILFCFSSSLCSLFGNMIADLMLGGLFIYMWIAKYRMKDRILLAVMMLPNLMVMLLYMKLG